MSYTPFKKHDVFVFDIDGTLADHKGIRGPFEEHKVFHDRPIEPVWKVLNCLKKEYTIIFLSGRTEACRYDTEMWLKTFLSEDPWVKGPILLMRKIGDNRKDSIVKKELYDTAILPNFNVIGVFDDRLQVCRMLYENNLFCFNVNQGLKEF